MFSIYICIICNIYNYITYKIVTDSYRVKSKIDNDLHFLFDHKEETAANYN